MIFLLHIIHKKAVTHIYVRHWGALHKCSVPTEQSISSAQIFCIFTKQGISSFFRLNSKCAYNVNVFINKS